MIVRTFAERVEARVRSHDTLLCVGLDPVPAKLPDLLGRDAEAVVKFCQGIIEATHPYVAAYKPNLGFFAGLGRTGLNALWAVRHAVPADIPVILDCKVGDVGETARAYAQGWFTEFGFDAITVNPYMGEDSLASFLEYGDRGVIVICKTSNPGSGDLQDLAQADGGPLFLTVADRCREWDERHPASVGLVVGATYPSQLQEVRRRAPHQVILLPGVGAQEGDLEASVSVGLNDQGSGLLCSASRAVIYASPGPEFGEAAGRVASTLRDQINTVRGNLAVR